jgi:hypothetical protein
MQFESALRSLRLEPHQVNFAQEVFMACKFCRSENQRNLNGEIAIHFPGFEGLNKPIVWVFSQLLVCLNCGGSEFLIPQTELDVLREDSTQGCEGAAGAGA